MTRSRRHRDLRRFDWRAGAAAPGDRAAALAPAATLTARDDGEPAELPVEPGWQTSSYDLLRGLDVIELPTTLSAEALDRVFRSGRH